MELTQHIHIRENSRVPKYRQVVDAIIDTVAAGHLEIDDKIPSINSFSETFQLSRDTVEKAYNILKERNIITSVKGKGFYITRTPPVGKINVLFLINKLSTYKMRIYNSFLARVGSGAHVDLHIYHCDESLFLNLIEKHGRAYDYYLIMPHFKDARQAHVSYTPRVMDALRGIPPNRLLILDNNKLELGSNHAEVYQDFELDIYHALSSGLDTIRKYRRLVLVFPENPVYPYPRRILRGFRRFCVENDFTFEITGEVKEDVQPEPGELYITIAESDLVNLVKRARDEQLRLGRDLGIISYNDTPLKDLLGITVVSTDFDRMGSTAAELILERRVDRIKNPFRWIERDSV